MYVFLSVTDYIPTTAKKDLSFDLIGWISGLMELSGITTGHLVIAGFFMIFVVAYVTGGGKKK